MCSRANASTASRPARVKLRVAVGTDTVTFGRLPSEVTLLRIRDALARTLARLVPGLLEAEHDLAEVEVRLHALVRLRNALEREDRVDHGDHSLGPEER